jgi:predicted Zn-dependent protease
MQPLFRHTHCNKLLTKLLLAISLSSLLATAALAQTTELPEMGAASGGFMTPAQERRLGQAFMRRVRNVMPVISDPFMNNYIESLGRRISRHSGDSSLPFHFFLVDKQNINAFAGPGGYIGIHTGLISTTESESELAAVIAHEIAHVTQHHLMRTFQMVDNMSLATTALVIAAVVLGAATDNPDLAMAASTGVQAGALQRQINFTRANEQEADRIGIRVTADAGFDPRAMPTFFHRMGKANRLYERNALPEFLRTHPVTTNRIADAMGRAETYPYKQYPDSLEYHLIRATIRERKFKDPHAAVKFYRSSLRDGRHRSAEGQRYGLVRALIRTRDYQAAKIELDKLLNKDPRRTHYLALKAEIAHRSGNPKQALSILSNGLKLNPSSYPLTIYYADMLLELGQARKAQTILEKLLKRRPLDAELQRMTARAAGDVGKTSEAHRYMAEYYYLNGDITSAIQQLEIALNDKNTSYHHSAGMAARLKEIRQELVDIESRK